MCIAEIRDIIIGDEWIDGARNLRRYHLERHGTKIKCFRIDINKLVAIQSLTGMYIKEYFGVEVKGIGDIRLKEVSRFIGLV